MNKKQKSSLNLFFSAFLIVAYVICAYFFERLIGARVDSETTQTAFKISIYIIFGLVLFYATRVGDGKQIVRFSLSSLILLVIPSIYILCCQFFPALPFSITLTMCGDVVLLAAVILGYGVPYTFTSGFELELEDEQDSEELDVKKDEPVVTADEKKPEDAKEEISVEPKSGAEEEDVPVDEKPAIIVDSNDESDDEIDSLDDI